MTTLALWQATAVTTVPGWVGPTMAISLGIIALSFIAIAAGVVVAALRIAAQVRKVGDVVAKVQDDVGRTVKTVRQMTEQGQEILGVVRSEAGAFAHTSRRVRHKIDRGVDRIEAKVQDLEALYEVVHDEVEDTALDVAATLRAARSGDGMVGRVRRILIPGR